MPLPKENRYTLADALAWPEQERAELIEGAPSSWPRRPASTRRSWRSSPASSGTIWRAKRAGSIPPPSPSACLKKRGTAPEDVDTMVEPDISIVCDAGKLDDAGCKGAPDMIAEVLSPSTQRHDRLVKYNLYQCAGVREYWIIDPENRTVQVSVLDGTRYRLSEVYTARDVAKVNVLDGCFIELSKLFPQ